MAWEQRGSKRVYCRSVRFGRRVRKQYCGSGPAAELAASLDQWSKLHRRQHRAAEAKARAAYDAAVAPLDALAACLDALLRATLYEAGFHHHRGEWRRRRGNKLEPRMEGGAATRPAPERDLRRSHAAAG